MYKINITISYGNTICFCNIFFTDLYKIVVVHYSTEFNERVSTNFIGKWSWSSKVPYFISKISFCMDLNKMCGFLDCIKLNICFHLLFSSKLGVEFTFPFYIVLSVYCCWIRFYKIVPPNFFWKIGTLQNPGLVVQLYLRA